MLVYQRVSSTNKGMSSTKQRNKGMRPFSASTAQMQAVPPLHMRARVYVSQAQIDRNVANHRRNRMVKLMNIINIPADGKPRERFDCLLPGESQSPVIYNIKCSS
jgi:hypothetical protein